MMDEKQSDPEEVKEKGSIPQYESEEVKGCPVAAEHCLFLLIVKEKKHLGWVNVEHLR